MAKVNFEGAESEPPQKAAWAADGVAREFRSRTPSQSDDNRIWRGEPWHKALLSHLPWHHVSDNPPKESADSLNRYMAQVPRGFERRSEADPDAHFGDYRMRHGDAQPGHPAERPAHSERRGKAGSGLLSSNAPQADARRPETDGASGMSRRRHPPRTGRAERDGNVSPDNRSSASRDGSGSPDGRSSASALESSLSRVKKAGFDGLDKLFHRAHDKSHDKSHHRSHHRSDGRFGSADQGSADSLDDHLYYGHLDDHKALAAAEDAAAVARIKAARDAHAEPPPHVLPNSAQHWHPPSEHFLDAPPDHFVNPQSDHFLDAPRASVASPGSPLSSAARESFLTYGILLLVGLVVTSLILGHTLTRKVHRSFTVPVVATVLGCFAGLILYFFGTHETYLLQNIVRFNEEIFFNFILPPIIFASGFELTGARGKLFFYRFGTILWFALFATFAAFVLNAGGFYLTGLLKVSVTLSLSQAMVLGALLSPTDPVTVLALFRDMKVDPVIETVVLGESLLNDAVAILLYRIIVRRPEGASVLGEGLAFVYQFVFSMLVGTIIGLLISLCTKIANFRRHITGLSSPPEQTINSVETALILLAPWASYLLAEVCDLSGVVACLFCGIAVVRYAVPNFSEIGGKVAAAFYKAFSTLAETLVFVLLGLSVFAFRVLWQPVMEATSTIDVDSHAHHWIRHILHSVSFGRVVFLHLFTLVFVSLGRLVSIALTAGTVNWLLRSASSGRLPRRTQYMVSLSGLRGAMAVALALKAQTDIGGASGSAIVSTTLVYTLFTILVVGPLLPTALRRLCEPSYAAIEGTSPVSLPRKTRGLKQHLHVWRALVKAVANLDDWLFAVVTERGRNGKFFGDRLFVWRHPEFLSDDEGDSENDFMRHDLSERVLQRLRESQRPLEVVPKEEASGEESPASTEDDEQLPSMLYETSEFPAPLVEAFPIYHQREGLRE